MSVLGAALIVASTSARAADNTVAQASSSAAPAGASMSAAERDAEIQELKARLEKLEAAQQAEDATIQAQQKQLETKAAQDKVVSTGSFPGSFKVPGTNTSIKIDGFVDLQTFYDPQQNLGDKFQVGNILPPSGAQAQTAGTFHAQGKLTRINIATETPSDHLGTLKTFFSMDFFNSQANGPGQTIQNNNYTPRVREAWGELGGFRIGKQWSLFQDDPDSMDSLDLSGPTGVPAEQVLELRYTHKLGIGSLAVAANSPATDYAGSDSASDVESASAYNPVPDFETRYEVGGKAGHLQVSGVWRKLAYDDGAYHRTMTTGGGMLVGGTLNLGQYSAVGGETWFGSGIERYSPDDFGPVSSAQINNINTPNQQIYAANSHGLAIYALHVWSAEFRSNVGYGTYAMQWFSFLPLTDSEPALTRTLHINTIWSPMKPIDIGIEYMNGTKAFRSGLALPDTNASRWEMAFKYKY
jgi:hypothetical protein